MGMVRKSLFKMTGYEIKLNCSHEQNFSSLFWMTVSMPIRKQSAMEV